MAQADYIISNQTFPNTRADINNHLSAIATNNSGTSAPTTQYAGQFWIDTTSTTWTLYIHDGTDDIQFATIDTSANTVNFTDSALDVVTDTTPQLGGNLDLNSNDITGTGNINITGTATVTGLTTTGDINFGDNDKAVFGAGSDLEIYHTGAASIIKDGGTGSLFIAGSSEVKITNDAINEDMAVFNHNGSVDLYYDNVKKFETTSTGIDVTGTVVSDGLTVDTNTLYVDSANNRVGVGTSSPSSVLDVDGQTRITGRILTGQGSVGATGYGFAGDGNTCMFSSANNTLQFGTSAAERMSIQSNGRITTFGQSTTNGALNLLGEAGASNKAIVFAHVGLGAEVGSITTGASSTSYNTSSDYRLKENVVDITGATERLKQLQPKRFNFITDADTTVDGFLAHEVSDIVPEAIIGTKDEVEIWEEGEELPEGISVGDNKLDDEGNTIPVYQGIDQSKLVPLLVASLKEALIEIDNLKARVDTLEGN